MPAQQTRHAGTMMLRRWPNIKTSLFQRAVFAGGPLSETLKALNYFCINDGDQRVILNLKFS